MTLNIERPFKSMTMTQIAEAIEEQPELEREARKEIFLRDLEWAYGYAGLERLDGYQ